MSNLTNDQLADLTQRIQARLAEFGSVANSLPKLTPGVVRIMVDEHEKLLPNPNDEPNRWRDGYLRGRADVTAEWEATVQTQLETLQEIVSRHQEREQPDFRLVRDANGRTAERTPWEADRAGDMPLNGNGAHSDPADDGDDWMSSDATPMEDAEPEPVMPAHLAAEGYDLERIYGYPLGKWRWRREGGNLAWGPPYDDPADAIADAERECECDLGYVPPKSDKKLTDSTTATLGPEHTVVTPLRNAVKPDAAHPWKRRVDGKPSNPIGRDRAPETLLDPDAAREKVATAIASGSGALVEAIKRPRTLADVDAESFDLPAPHARAYGNKVVPSREQVIAELQRQAMGGVMPSMDAFNVAKPANWATAQAHMVRMGLTWGELAQEAGLKFRGRER